MRFVSKTGNRSFDRKEMVSDSVASDPKQHRSVFNSRSVTFRSVTTRQQKVAGRNQTGHWKNVEHAGHVFGKTCGWSFEQTLKNLPRCFCIGFDWSLIGQWKSYKHKKICWVVTAFESLRVARDFFNRPRTVDNFGLLRTWRSFSKTRGSWMISGFDS